MVDAKAPELNAIPQSSISSGHRDETEGSENEHF
jgi:hypothetical protein